MNRPKSQIFNWNHFSDKLTPEQVEKLTTYFCVYHRKCWTFKKATKKFKRWRLFDNSMSVLFASSGIISAIVTHGVSLVAVSTLAMLIQAYMKHKDVDLKIHLCTYAYQSYQHLLIRIKDMARSGEYNPSSLHTMMNNIDNYVIDNSPIIDKLLHKYDEKFTN